MELQDNQTLDSLRISDTDILIAKPDSNPKPVQNVRLTPNNNVNQAPTISAPNQLQSSPEYNPELQRRLMEQIRMENVEKNMEEALQHNPESFASVVSSSVDISLISCSLCFMWIQKLMVFL